MSAPVLTPLFDEDVIREFEEHSDEEIPCEEADAAAEVRVSARCCGESTFMCLPHFVAWKVGVEVRLALFGQLRCAHCKAKLLSAASVSDLVRVVPL